ncbi:putative syntaxin domain-containing protein [Helianthus annuus]|nr:putative syntaxin domain-containing protein [Helianthus annuus]KAJ0654843.1 putative syntaxin domain-containing protein [Helianthus annuus]
MNNFNDLRNKMSSEYRETVTRRYYTVTGENPDEKTVDTLISSGESETFLQKAIQEQGRGQVMDTILEIQKRHDAGDLSRSTPKIRHVIISTSSSLCHVGQKTNLVSGDLTGWCICK